MTTRKVILLVIIVALSALLIPYSVPLILSLLTAMLLEPFVKLLIRSLKVNRTVAVIISFSLFLIVFGLGGYWVVANLIIQGVQLAQYLPAFSGDFFDLMEKYVIRLEAYYALFPQDTGFSIHEVVVGIRSSALDAASSLTKWMVGAVTAIPNLLLISVVYFVGLFLVSIDLPGIRVWFMDLFTASAREKVELVLTQLSKAAVGFLRAQFILSMITYMLALIGLLILGVKFAALIALAIIIVDILPIVGTGSFLMPWTAYSFLIGNSRMGFGLIIIFVVITVVRRIIEPKILGSSLGISALATLVSIYLGFQMVGFFGLILGPAIVIVFEALREAGFLKSKIDF